MASVETYFEDGANMAAKWLAKAHAEVDEQFGDGFAHAHPELVAAMVQASALSFHASWLGKAVDEHGLFSKR